MAEDMAVGRGKRSFLRRSLFREVTIKATTTWATQSQERAWLGCWSLEGIAMEADRSVRMKLSGRLVGTRRDYSYFESSYSDMLGFNHFQKSPHRREDHVELRL